MILEQQDVMQYLETASRYNQLFSMFLQGNTVAPRPLLFYNLQPPSQAGSLVVS